MNYRVHARTHSHGAMMWHLIPLCLPTIQLRNLHMHRANPNPNPNPSSWGIFTCMEPNLRLWMTKAGHHYTTLHSTAEKPLWNTLHATVVSTSPSPAWTHAVPSHACTVDYILMACCATDIWQKMGGGAQTQTLKLKLDSPPVCPCVKSKGTCFACSPTRCSGHARTRQVMSHYACGITCKACDKVHAPAGSSLGTCCDITFKIGCRHHYTRLPGMNTKVCVRS